MVTRKPPEPSEPLFVKVYTTPPALVLSAFATAAKPNDAIAISAANTRTFFMKLPPGNCTLLLRGPVCTLLTSMYCTKGQVEPPHFWRTFLLKIGDLFCFRPGTGIP